MEELFLVIRNERIYAFSKDLKLIHSYLELYYSHKDSQKFKIQKIKKKDLIKKAYSEHFDLELVERIEGIVLPELEYEIFENMLKELYLDLKYQCEEKIYRYKKQYPNETPKFLKSYIDKFNLKLSTYERFIEFYPKDKLKDLTISSDTLREYYELDTEYKEKLSNND